MGEQVSTSDNPFLRELCLQRLPANVRMVLASTDTEDLQDLAHLADKVMEVAPPSVSSVRTGNSSSDIIQLRSEIADLCKMFETFMSTQPSPRPRTPSRGRPPTPVPPQPTVCWYYQNFGTAAQKCRSPCSFAGNDQASH